MLILNEQRSGFLFDTNETKHQNDQSNEIKVKRAIN